jgi:hypothetical protein
MDHPVSKARSRIFSIFKEIAINIEQYIEVERVLSELYQTAFDAGRAKETEE